jgi:hypothetical protein
METRTLHVLVSTVTGARGATSYDPRLLRGRITDRDTQAIVPWSESGSLARIRREVDRQQAKSREEAAISDMIDAAEGDDS